MSENIQSLSDRVTSLLRTRPRPGADDGEKRSWVARKHAIVSELIMLYPERDRRSFAQPVDVERRSVSPVTSPLEDVLAGRPHVEAP